MTRAQTPPKTTPPKRRSTQKAHADPQSSANQKEQLLQAFLELAATEGWSEQTLQKAAQTCGMADVMVWALFPEKEVDALRTWSNVLNTQLKARLHALDLDTMKVRTRIFWGVKMHLNLLEPHKKTAKSALRFLLSPSRALLATELLQATVHTIWSAAGDASTDYNFYSKRILLAGVYISTVLFWLRDASPEHLETNRFLEARINDVLKLQAFKPPKDLIQLGPTLLKKAWQACGFFGSR